MVRYDTELPRIPALRRSHRRVRILPRALDSNARANNQDCSPWFFAEMKYPRRPSEGLSKRDERREKILDNARAVFLARGYAASSMSTIADRLGGSKGTLYNYFKSKEELFAACISRHCAWQSDVMFSVNIEGLGVSAALNVIGRNYLTVTLSDNNLRMFRLVAAEAERDPAIGQLFYESGPKRGLGRLTEFLSERSTSGELSIVDAPRSASNLVALCINRLMTMRLCNFTPEPTSDDIKAEVEQAVDIFLSLHAAQRLGLSRSRKCSSPPPAQR